MKVISISTDRKIFEQGSAVRARQVEYGALFDELHIVVFTGRADERGNRYGQKTQIAPNVWVYPTNSFSKISRVFDATRIARSVVKEIGVSTAQTAAQIVVTTQDPFETGLVGARLARQIGVRLHVQIHTDFLSPFFARESFLNRFRVHIAKRVLRQAYAVRVVSKRIADSVIAAKLTKCTPEVLPIFVDTAHIEQAVVDDANNLQKKYPQFNFIILMASRLTKEKNIEFALDMFAKLVAEYPRTGLVVVGSGGRARSLHQRAKSLHIEQSVVFEPWSENLVSYYKTAHVFLVTSNYEGFGMTLIEAIASGCPVVSTNVGIAQQLLHDGSTSPVCEIGDIACFLDTLAGFIEQPSARKHVLIEAQNRLGQIVALDKMQYLNAYKSLIERALL